MKDVNSLPTLTPYDAYPLSQRKYDALVTHINLDSALQSLNSGTTGDFIAMDLKQDLHYLGEIVGEISSEDLLDSIFFWFCIVK